MINLDNIIHKELRNFISNNNKLKWDKFYVKEFKSNSGAINYIHYFDSGLKTIVHESFVYNNSINREKDFTILMEKVVYNK